MRTFIQILVGNGVKPTYRLEEIKIAFNKYLNQQEELLNVNHDVPKPLVLAKVKELNHVWFDKLVKCSSRINADGMVGITMNMNGIRMVKYIHKSKLDYLINKLNN